jgi:hypothetical protein
VGRGWRKGSRIVEFTFHKQLSFAVWKERETERERERERETSQVSGEVWHNSESQCPHYLPKEGCPIKVQMTE